jgi:hypothetical protein
MSNLRERWNGMASRERVRVFVEQSGAELPAPVG